MKSPVLCPVRKCMQHSMLTEGHLDERLPKTAGSNKLKSAPIVSESGSHDLFHFLSSSLKAVL